MHLTCAPFCLTRFAVLVVAPRNLRMKMRAMVESERLISSTSSSSSTSSPNNTNKYKKLKRSVGDSVIDDAVKSDALKIQAIKENSVQLEGMTFQQLRTMSRNFGIPAKGSKNDLLLALKCFLDNGKDEMRPSDPESTVTRSKLKNLPSEDQSQNPHESDVSLLQQKKRRRKPPSVDGATVEDNSKTVMTKQKLSVTTEEIPDTCGSTAGVGLSGQNSEPWTVLAHKKPQQGWIPYNPRTMRPPPLADDTKFVKLISWNVNGLRALLKLEGFSALQLAKRENFDVLCLQETKLQENDVEEIKRSLIDGYENSFWTCSVSKLGYSGTAIISRIKPLSVRYGLGIHDHDSEGRLVTVEFDTFYLISGYVPNSGDGLKRLTYRVTQWDPSLGSYMKELEKSKPVILTGDLNCAHQEIDIFNPAGNRRSAGFTDEERQSFETNFLSKGYVDTFRRQHPGVVGYTYWGYRHRGRVVNKGWRLDYFLVSESIVDKVHDSYILPDILGSDHCPIGLVLKL